MMGCLFLHLEQIIGKRFKMKVINSIQSTAQRKVYKAKWLLYFIGSAFWCLCDSQMAHAQQEIAKDNVVWTSQSNNSAESMPVGGGDVGLNVWVEKGEVYLYLSRSGTFDENNTLLKLGRVKLKLTPNPFIGSTFKQELLLKDGYVQISGTDGKLNAEVKVWVDVFKPIVNLGVKANQNIIV
jgi:hypothetical protein